MSVKTEVGQKYVRAFLEGEIDHHSAAFIRKDIDRIVAKKKPKLLILDFSAVSFMDSSGIGLVMGRYKLIKSLGGEIRVENLSASSYKIMRLAGIERLGEIRQKETV